VSEERVEWVVQRRLGSPAVSWQDAANGRTAAEGRALLAWCRDHPDGCKFRLVRRTVREEVCE
jgi:hypothetical protein